MDRRNKIEKTCNECGSTKPVSEFFKNKLQKDGLNGHCKKCHTARGRKFRDENPEIVHVWDRKNMLKGRFQLTIEEYDAMLEAQNNVCKICRRVCRTGKRLAVDHDRRCCAGNKTCGKCVRGLLCQGCNTALGKFNDDPDMLRVAIQYLEEYRDARATV